MDCGRFYEWTNKQTRNIPLPEIAKELLRCKSDKIFKFYYTGEENVFNIIIGCDTKEDAVNFVVRNLTIELEEAKEKIELWRPEWEIHSPFPWSKIKPHEVWFPQIAKDIIKYQTDKIYRIKNETSSDEFQIIVGAKSLEEAVETATDFEYWMNEDYYKRSDVNIDEIYDGIYSWMGSNTDLWTINDDEQESPE